MTITVNGTPTFLSPPLTVTDYLTAHRYQINRIAVELNGQILPKRLYDSTRLQEGDILEIVSFVGGG